MHKLLISGFAVIGLATLAATTQLASSQAETLPADDRLGLKPDEGGGLAAWEKIYEVFSHPRCANCHVEDGRPMWSGPSYGKTRVHGMYVGGDPDQPFGNPGLMCNTCHGHDNSPKLHGPPGAEVWLLAPKEFVWWQKSSAEICEQVKDPKRNGGWSLEEIRHHVAEDALVAWGWDPGPGREPAPYSAKETAAFVAAWAANGAPCPGDGVDKE